MYLLKEIVQYLLSLILARSLRKLPNSFLLDYEAKRTIPPKLSLINSLLYIFTYLNSAITHSYRFTFSDIIFTNKFFN